MGTENADGPDPLAEAIAAEEQIAGEAAECRGGAQELTAELFGRLWPLLRRPIPAGFIKTTGVVKGKPYPSTGIKSMQVQVDRLDNVLTPLWWGWETVWDQEGHVATVRAWVGQRDRVLYERVARGGVEQASTLGNRLKGSETNAAKLCFARLGPGHEIYVGATDLDPDVSEDAAAAQAAPAGRRTAGAGDARITKTRAGALYKAAGRAGVLEKLQLAASHAHGDDVGDCSTEAKAATALVKLTVDQANAVAEWIERKALDAS